MTKRILGAAIFCAVQMAFAAPAWAAPTTGAINADGTKQVASAKYTVSHPGTGHYIVTFKVPYTPIPICTVNPLPNVYGQVITVQAIFETSTTCEFYFANGASPFDAVFNFMALQATH